MDNVDDLLELKSKINLSDFDKYCIYGFLTSSNVDNIQYKTDVHKIAILHDDVDNVKDNDDIMYHIFLPQTSNLQTYIEKYPINKRVKIEDAFDRQNSNKNYPVLSIFSDLFNVYKENNYIGFGDYLTLGDNFNIPDGANMKNVTCALHLTYLKDNMLYIKHYIKTPNEEPRFIQRVIDVLTQAENEKHLHTDTTGMRIITEKYKTGTNLATLKRISLEHHIEMINKMLFE